jgi:hypothetical protein
MLYERRLEVSNRRSTIGAEEQQPQQVTSYFQRNKNPQDVPASGSPSHLRQTSCHSRTDHGDYPPQIGHQTACLPQEGSPRHAWYLGRTIGERAIQRTLAQKDRPAVGLDPVVQGMSRKVSIVTLQLPKSNLWDGVTGRRAI